MSGHDGSIVELNASHTSGLRMPTGRHNTAPEQPPRSDAATNAATVS